MENEKAQVIAFQECPECGHRMMDVSSKHESPNTTIQCANIDCEKRQDRKYPVTYKRLDVRASSNVDEVIGEVRKQEQLAFQDLNSKTNSLTSWICRHRPEWLDGKQHPIETARNMLERMRLAGSLPYGPAGRLDLRDRLARWIMGGRA